MSRRILFVDDEPKVIRGLRRMLGTLEDSWVLEFAESGQEALDFLDREKCDVVVSDFRMPGMNGHEFLTIIKERFPWTIRMLLSGQTDEANSLRAVGSAHQYLAKPCDPEILRETIQRSFALGDLLKNSQLKEFISQLETLPTLPSLYQELLQEIESENCSLENIGNVIGQDIGMTAKILKLVNSAFLGVSRKISNPVQAVNIIGLDTLKTLVLTIKVFEQMNSRPTSRISLESIWNHSLRTGEFSRKIMKAESPDPALADDALASGLLHDLGILILASQMPDVYDKVVSLAQETEGPLDEAERQVFGVTHAEVGAYLLGLWGLNYTIVEAVAFHHIPLLCSEESPRPLMAVQAGNILCHEAENSSVLRADLSAEQELVDHIISKEKMDVWRTLCLNSEE